MSTPAAPQTHTTHPLFTSPLVRAAFLRTSWGKRPVLFRRLFPTFTPPFTRDELAYLCTLPHARTRLIEGPPPGPYTLRLGPFPPSVLSALPTRDWTILLHDANRHVPELASQLQQPFSFIPNWRADDVMVSYAPPGGSVGPHVDNYDVFLVQGAGRRVWRTAYAAITSAAEVLVEGCDVRVLQGGFEADEEWTLEPGDALYVPPRFPHHGVSLDEECMTFSVGFRAPAVAELVHGWAEEVVQGEVAGEFFTDCVEDLVRNVEDPGRITNAAVDRAFEAVVHRFRSSEEMRERFAVWFASEVSQPKRLREPDEEDNSLGQAEVERIVDEILASSKNLSDRECVKVRQQEGAVFTYLQNGSQVSMYIDGERWPVASLQIARTICGARCLDGSILADLAVTEPSMRTLLKRLFLSDLLYIEEDEADFEES